MKVREFFCEACGNSVSLKASKCSNCGKLFDSVKCPKCEFSGAATLFNNGCPACGYLSKGEKPTAGDFVTVEKGLVAPDAEGMAISAPCQPGGSAKKDPVVRTFARWVYTALTIALVATLVIIGIVYLRL